VKKINRKEFLKMFAKVSGGVAFTPVLFSVFNSCTKPSPFEPPMDGTLYFSECPCHKARFDQEGNVLNNTETGDNIASLTLYETNFTDDAITIEGSNQTIFFSNHPDLQNVEGISSLTTIDIEPDGILLYRKSQSKIIALSRNCTHEGCQIGEFQYA